MYNMGQQRHNSTSSLLLKFLNQETNGPWVLIAADTGRQPPLHLFTNLHTPDDVETLSPTEGVAPTRKYNIHESDLHYTVATSIPEWILLPGAHRPPNYKLPHIIKIVSCHLGNRGEPIPTNSRPPTRQIIDFKYSSDHDYPAVFDSVMSKYAQLAQAIRARRRWPYPVEITHVILGRVGSYDPHTKHSWYRLIYLKDKPPDKHLPKA